MTSENTKRGQLYRLPMSAENVEMARAGQCVFPGNDSDMIVGFISEIDYDTNELEICLFDVSDTLPAKVTILRETLTADECAEYLRPIVDRDPEMHKLWRDMINEIPTIQ